MAADDDTGRLHLRDLSTILFDLKHGYTPQLEATALSGDEYAAIVNDLHRRGLVAAGSRRDPKTGEVVECLRLTPAGEKLYEELSARMKHTWGIIPGDEYSDLD